MAASIDDRPDIIKNCPLDVHMDAKECCAQHPLANDTLTSALKEDHSHLDGVSRDLAKDPEMSGYSNMSNKGVNEQTSYVDIECSDTEPRDNPTSKLDSGDRPESEGTASQSGQEQEEEEEEEDSGQEGKEYGRVCITVYLKCCILCNFYYYENSGQEVKECGRFCIILLVVDCVISIIMKMVGRMGKECGRFCIILLVVDCVISIIMKMVGRMGKECGRFCIILLVVDCVISIIMRIVGRKLRNVVDSVLFYWL